MRVDNQGSSVSAAFSFWRNKVGDPKEPPQSVNSNNSNPSNVQLKRQQFENLTKLNTGNHNDSNFGKNQKGLNSAPLQINTNRVQIADKDGGSSASTVVNSPVEEISYKSFNISSKGLEREVQKALRKVQEELRKNNSKVADIRRNFENSSSAKGK